MKFCLTSIALLSLFILLFIEGCSHISTQLAQPAIDPVSEGFLCADGREVLGRYTLHIDPAAQSADLVPCREASTDKQYLQAINFKLETIYVGLLHNPLCHDDWLAGDITFNEKVTNLGDTDYYDLWLVILDGHGGELADPSSWGTASGFNDKLQYIAYCTDDPLRKLPAGQSDTRTHVWRNPCGGNPIFVDLALVGKPGSPSGTAGDITADPETIPIPVWNPLNYANIRARINDHQGDSIVAIDSNNIGIPLNFPLYDDGAHGDDGPHDGLYATGDLPVGNTSPGIYEAWIRAVSPGDIIKVYNKVEIQVGYIDPTWDTAVSLRKTDYSNQICYCDLAMDSTGRLHLAWTERYDWGGVYVIMCYYRNYKDGVLSDTVHLNKDVLMYGGTLPYLSNPQLVIGPGDEVYVFWHQWSPLMDGKIAMYSRMRKDGVWHDPKRIDGDVPYSIYEPQAVCTPSGEIFLAAKDYRDGVYGICATSVQAGSDDWPATVRMCVGYSQDNFSLEGIESMKAATDGFVYLALTRYDGGNDLNIYMLKIEPESMQVIFQTRVSDPDSAADKELHPCAWLDPSGAIGVVWEGLKDAGTNKTSIYYDISTDGGQTWGTDRIAFDQGDFGAMLPVMKAYGPGLWGLTFNYDHHNFYIMSLDGGQTFSPIETMQDFGSTNLPNFVTGPGFESWHVWRSNYIDTDFNVFLRRRHY